MSRNAGKCKAELHIYASGSNKRVGGIKESSGDGSTVGLDNVEKAIKHANKFTRRHGLLSNLPWSMDAQRQRTWDFDAG